MVRTFQLTKSLNRMTVMDNMMLGAQGQRGETPRRRRCCGRCGAARSGEIEEKAKELLDRFSLLEKKDDFAGSLSGGQRKLLEMARALMSDPKMIMLDEPMAGVNPALTQSLLGHIQSPARRGHDRALRRARHARGAPHLRLGRGDGRGPDRGRGSADTVMSDPAVIDAYLGAHHDTDLGDDALLSEETLEQFAEEVAAEEPSSARRSSRRATEQTGHSRSSRQPTSWRATCRREHPQRLQPGRPTRAR